MATSKKIALRWVEVLLILTTVLSGMSIYIFWKQQALVNSKYKLPSEDSFKNIQFHSDQDLKIGRIESKISQYKEAIKAKEAQQIELGLQLSNIKAQYTCLPDSLKLSKRDSTQTLYCNLLAQSQLRKAEIEYLDKQLINLQQRLLALNLAKADTQKADLKRFTDAKSKVSDKRSQDVLLYTAISLALLYLTLFFFMGWGKGVEIFNWRRGAVLGISASVLFILFTYEVFGLYGPLGLCLLALIAIIVLIHGNQQDKPKMKET